MRNRALLRPYSRTVCAQGLVALKGGLFLMIEVPLDPLNREPSTLNHKAQTPSRRPFLSFQLGDGRARRADGKLRRGMASRSAYWQAFLQLTHWQPFLYLVLYYS